MQVPLLLQPQHFGGLGGLLGGISRQLRVREQENQAAAAAGLHQLTDEHFASSPHAAVRLFTPGDAPGRVENWNSVVKT